MKYFVISDTHSHHDEVVSALNEAGFDEKNKDHFLIVAGDITDRGSQTLAHLLYLKNLTDKGRAVVLKGNHDNFILGFFKNIDQSFNWMNNGLRETIDDLDHCTASFETYCMLRNKELNTRNFPEWQRVTAASIKREYPWIQEWIQGFPNYYETENYAITHGIVNQNIEDWRKSDWSDCHWARPEDYIYFNNPTNKTLVVGHLNASLMEYTRKYKTKQGYDVYTYKPENHTYYDEDIDTYFVDSCTILSKRVNVLVFEDRPV